MELVSNRRDDDKPIRIKIRLVGDMVKEDPQYIQFFNIIMRKCLEHMKLQLVGRNYFDARSSVSRNLHFVIKFQNLITYICDRMFVCNGSML